MCFYTKLQFQKDFLWVAVGNGFIDRLFRDYLENFREPSDFLDYFKRNWNKSWLLGRLIVSGIKRRCRKK